MHPWIPALLTVLLLAPTAGGLELKKTIWGHLTPKSVVYDGQGRFFTQNMMYQHGIRVYGRDFKLIRDISDSVTPSDFGFADHRGSYLGSPVEAAFSPDGRYAWVTNYRMKGPGYHRPGIDHCRPSDRYDDSFVYKIDTRSLEIVALVRVGAVPKFLTATPDGRYLLVSNWCDWNVSVIDAHTDRELSRLAVGRYPRGIAIDAQSQRAYVALMGERDVAVISLSDLSFTRLLGIGHAPRSVTLSPDGRFLYASLNDEGRVAKVDLQSGEVVKKVFTGMTPRSMALSADGRYLYVVNFRSDTVAKVRTDKMRKVAEVPTNPSPIGVAYDPEQHRVWVACYSGSLMVFQD